MLYSTISVACSVWPNGAKPNTKRPSPAVVADDVVDVVEVDAVDDREQAERLPRQIELPVRAPHAVQNLLDAGARREREAVDRLLVRNDESIASTIAGASAGVGAMFSMSLPNVHAPPGPVRTGSSTTLTSRISSSRRGLTVHGVELSKTEKFTIWLNDSKVKGEKSWPFTPICDVPNCSMSGEAVTVNGRCAVPAAGTKALPKFGLTMMSGLKLNGNALKLKRSRPRTSCS